MRKCTFKLWFRGSGHTEPIDGEFHGFGKKIIETNDGGLAEETIAIVEDEQGTLHGVEIDTVTFKKE